MELSQNHRVLFVNFRSGDLIQTSLQMLADNAGCCLVSRFSMLDLNQKFSAVFQPESIDRAFINSDSTSDIAAIERDLFPILSSGAILYLVAANGENLQRFVSSLVLNGYMDCNVNSSNFSNVISSCCAVECVKPNWSVGEIAQIPFKAKNGKPPKTQEGNKWKLTQMVEDDLIDEDDLLKESEADLLTATRAPPTNDCASRKPCKNCSCGRVQRDTKAAAPLPKSSCGSCYKGDAFRCASCPFLGQPAFQPTNDNHVMIDVNVQDI